MILLNFRIHWAGVRCGASGFPRGEIDLDQRGIRDFEYWPARKAYVIIGGPINDENKSFQLYLWSGSASDKPRKIPGVSFGDLHPEALIVGEDQQQLLVFCDDGARQTEGRDCKDLEPNRQEFRTVLVTLDPEGAP